VVFARLNLEKFFIVDIDTSSNTQSIADASLNRSCKARLPTPLSHRPNRLFVWCCLIIADRSDCPALAPSRAVDRLTTHPHGIGITTYLLDSTAPDTARRPRLVSARTTTPKMGNVFSLFSDKLRRSREIRILMLGLDAAGKTTILYSLKLPHPVTTIPTVGFNVESVTMKNVKFNIWDVGGQDKIRPLWRHYYSGT